MSFSSVINLGTVSPAITQVKLYECTGNNTGCVALTNYSAVNVNTFPITVSGINDNTSYIKVEALGTCAGTIQSLLITGKPGTPTPTPTSTPTPTPTVTPTSGGPTFTPTPTPTVTPTPTPNFYNITVNLQGAVGQNGNLQVYQSSDGISYQSSITLTSTDGEYKTSGFNGTPGYYYYLMVARTSGGTVMNQKVNLYTQVNVTDFSPGPINGAWCDNGNTLQSDTFQLPNPVQNRQSIIFYGGLNEGCL